MHVHLFGKRIITPTKYEYMDSVFVTATFARDAGVEHTGTYLQRLAVANTGIMSAAKRVYFKPRLPFFRKRVYGTIKKNEYQILSRTFLSLLV